MILEPFDYLEEHFCYSLCLRGVYLPMGSGSGCDDMEEHLKTRNASRRMRRPKDTIPRDVLCIYKYANVNRHNKVQCQIKKE